MTASVEVARQAGAPGTVISQPGPAAAAPAWHAASGRRSISWSCWLQRQISIRADHQLPGRRWDPLSIRRPERAGSQGSRPRRGIGTDHRRARRLTSEARQPRRTYLHLQRKHYPGRLGGGELDGVDPAGPYHPCREPPDRMSCPHPVWVHRPGSGQIPIGLSALVPKHPACSGTVGHPNLEGGTGSGRSRMSGYGRPGGDSRVRPRHPWGRG